MTSRKVPKCAGLDSLPPAERAKICWASYEELLDEFEEHTPRRDKIDACVLQYARAVADVAMADQLADLASVIGERALRACVNLEVDP